MVLTPAVSHLSHGHVAIDHGTFYDFNFCPMGHILSPMVLSIICPMDMLHLTLGPYDTSTSVPWAIMYVPWTCCNTPWAILILQPLSPWTCCNAPWGFLTLPSLSHGL